MDVSVFGISEYWLDRDGYDDDDGDDNGDDDGDDDSYGGDDEKTWMSTNGYAKNSQRWNDWLLYFKHTTHKLNMRQPMAMAIAPCTHVLEHIFV